MIAVIAGNEAQYQVWLRATKTNPTQAVHVDSVSKAVGNRFDRLVTYGTWYNRPDADELCGLVLTRICSAQ
jgi:hypothetical protein